MKRKTKFSAIVATLLVAALVFTSLNAGVPKSALATVVSDSDWQFTDTDDVRTYNKFTGTASNVELLSVPENIKSVIIATNCFDGKTINSIRIGEDVPLTTIQSGAFSGVSGLSTIIIEPMNVGIAQTTGLPSSGVTIKAYKGSTTESYCKNNTVAGFTYLPKITLTGRVDTYNGSAHSLEADGSGFFEKGDIKVEYRVKGGTDWTQDAPTNAGTYEVRATGNNSSYGTIVSKIVDLIIEKRDIIISDLDVLDKVYDGSDSATITDGKISGILDYDAPNVIVTLPTSGTFSDKNVGVSKVVTANVPALTGTKASNYKIAPISLKGNISAKPVTLNNVRVADKVYDGTTKATISQGNIQGVITGDKVSLDTIQANFETKDVGTNRVVRITSTKLLGSGASNYTLEIPNATYLANITKRTLTATAVDCTKYKGRKNPDLKVSVTGFAEGESEKTLSGYIAPIASCKADSSTGVGTNTISVSGGNATSNYEFNYVPGQLTIVESETADKYSIVSNDITKQGSTSVTISGVKYGDSVIAAAEYRWLKGQAALSEYSSANIGNILTATENNSVYTLFAKLADGTIIYEYKTVMVAGGTSANTDNTVLETNSDKYSFQISKAQTPGQTVVTLDGLKASNAFVNVKEYRYVKGQHDANYFSKAAKGVKFTVKETSGVYTVYAKLEDGSIIYAQINVVVLPAIGGTADNDSNYTFNIDTVKSSTYTLIKPVSVSKADNTKAEVAEYRYLDGYYTETAFGAATPLTTDGLKVTKNNSTYTIFARLTNGTVLYKKILVPVGSTVKVTTKLSTTKLTNKNVIATISVSGSFDYYTVNSKKYTSSTAKVTCTSSKSLVIKVYSGAKCIKTVTKKVTNIDKTKPTLKFKVLSNKNIKVSVSDNRSGKITTKYMKGYKYATSYAKATSVKSFKAQKGVVYTIFAKDAVGNITVKRIKVTKSCRIYF